MLLPNFYIFLVKPHAASFCLGPGGHLYIEYPTFHVLISSPYDKNSTPLKKRRWIGNFFYLMGHNCVLTCGTWESMGEHGEIIGLYPLWIKSGITPDISKIRVLIISWFYLRVRNLQFELALPILRIS